MDARNPQLRPYTHDEIFYGPNDPLQGWLVEVSKVVIADGACRWTMTYAVPEEGPKERHTVLCQILDVQGKKKVDRALLRGSINNPQSKFPTFLSEIGSTNEYKEQLVDCLVSLFLWSTGASCAFNLFLTQMERHIHRDLRIECASVCYDTGLT
jgi:hypothetical protein